MIKTRSVWPTLGSKSPAEEVDMNRHFQADWALQPMGCLLYILKSVCLFVSVCLSVSVFDWWGWCFVGRHSGNVSWTVRGTVQRNAGKSEAWTWLTQNIPGGIYHGRLLQGTVHQVDYGVDGGACDSLTHWLQATSIDICLSWCLGHRNNYEHWVSEQTRVLRDTNFSDCRTIVVKPHWLQE